MRYARVVFNLVPKVQQYFAESKVYFYVSSHKSRDVEILAFADIYGSILKKSALFRHFHKLKFGLFYLRFALLWLWLAASKTEKSAGFLRLVFMVDFCGLGRLGIRMIVCRDWLGGNGRASPFFARRFGCACFKRINFCAPFFSRGCRGGNGA